jgi:serine/threonine protein kinase
MGPGGREAAGAGGYNTQEGRASDPFVNVMAEPQGKPDTPHQGGKEPLPSSSPSASSSPDQAFTAKDSLLNAANIEPTDDAPTIITRTPLTPVRPENTLADVLRGRRLAHFELLEPIGVGGMAAVIRAKDTQLDRTVALKVLPPEMAVDPEIVRRFHQEARAAAKLDHENIARVFFCGEDQGLHFIAFEYVEGDNLRTILERRGRIPVPEAIHYMLQIATGLAHSSARGVVHRDIKPSNIIISPNGRAKLVDMGLARSLDPHTDGGLTQSGVTLGTFDYISPEQALEPREADARSDIYSLGCTMYHMLTGQPPVPEGTAARKLHHHQHVDPIDPRQLNPEIPDDVAALLARMMAKDPRGRYQRPEHLVQHLISLAQKLGGGAEVPEGVLFVDAPLPDPPYVRPLWVALSAVVGLLVLIFVLSPPPVSNSTSHSGNGSAENPPRGLVPDPEAKVKTETPSKSPEEKADRQPFPREGGLDTFEAHSVKDLADLLREDHPGATIYLTHDLDLTPEDQLLFQGQRLTLTTKNPERAPTIRLKYNAEPTKTQRNSAALTIKKGTVEIRGVRFVVDSTQSDLIMTALAWQGGQLILDHCEFAQVNPTEPGRISSITVSGPSTRTDRPALILSHCYFASGQHAITWNSPATVHLSQCAFGPHTATLFNLRRNGNLTLSHCSAFVQGGAVIRLNDDVTCQAKVENCLFSRPENDPRAQGPAALVEQTGDRAGTLQYAGSHNAYHNLKAFWFRSSAHQPEAPARPGDEPEAITSLNAFRERFHTGDDESVELTRSPWEDPEPLQALREDPPRPQEAFRVLTALPELRQKDDPSHVIGVERCVWGDSYDKLAPLEDRKPAEAVVRKDEKIIDPTLKSARRGENQYQSLEQASPDLNPGDTILLKFNGPLPVKPVRLLERAGTDVTIKPYPNYHPVLTIGPTTERDAALFRIHDGQLKLEHLEFHLLPGALEFKAQTVVAIMGDGQCTFKDCVVTLEGNRQVPLSLITLGDPSEAMRMGAPPAQEQIPRVEAEGCFVRGTGNLVTVRASRAFNLKVDSSLVALDGSLLLIEGSAKDLGARGYATLTLNQVTTYLTEHLILLRAFRDESKNSKGLVLTQVSAPVDCLFVSANKSKSLIHLEGFESEEQMKRLFSWRGGQHNAYNCTPLLDQQPWEDSPMMAPTPYGMTQWKDFTQEQDGRFDKVKFSEPLGPETPLAKVKPADFKVKSEMNQPRYGADSERLPKPFEEGISGKRPSEE